MGQDLEENLKLSLFHEKAMSPDVSAVFEAGNVPSMLVLSGIILIVIGAIAWSISLLPIGPALVSIGAIFLALGIILYLATEIR